MCVSCVCRKNSVSVLCVFVFLPPNFCKSTVVCVYLLSCFPLSLYCQISVCLSLCVCCLSCRQISVSLSREFIYCRVLRLSLYYCQISVSVSFALALAFALAVVLPLKFCVFFMCVYHVCAAKFL